MGTGHRWNDTDRAKQKHSEKTRLRATFFTINDLEFNPGFHSESPVNGRHKHDKTAVLFLITNQMHYLSKFILS
jgi:hypothetical protein